MPSDSISSYDSSASKYTVGPSIMQQKRATSTHEKGPVTKDTIETPKAKSERLNPFKAEGKPGNVAGEQAVKIARAGRFIFFSIALPPFFLMYSLPKMFALNVLPAMLAQVEKGFQHAKKLLQQINKWLTASLMTPFRNIFGKIKWSPKGIEKQSSSMMDFINRGFRNVTQLVARPVKAVYQTAKKAYEQVKEKVVEKFGAWAQETREIVEKVADKVKHQMENIYQATAQPVINWMIPKVKLVQQQIEKGFKFAKENVKELTQKIAEAMKPAVKVVQQAGVAMQAAVAKALNQITQYAQPMINLFVPTYEFLKKHLSFSLRWLREKPREQLLKFHKAASKFMRGLIPMVGDRFGSAKRKYQKMLGKFSGGVKKAFPFMKPLIEQTNLVYGKLIDFLKSLVRAFVNVVKAVYFRFERQLSPVKKGIVNFGHFIVAQLKQMAKAPIAYMKELIKMVMNLLLKVVKLSLMILIGFGLVFKYWFEMLYELGEEIGSWSGKKQATSK